MVRMPCVTFEASTQLGRMVSQHTETGTLGIFLADQVEFDQ